MRTKQLDLKIENSSGFTPLTLSIDRLIVAGWVGKDETALQAHIAELGRLGVPAPTRIPTYMNLSTILLTTSKEIDVVGKKSSGEVECVLIKSSGKVFIGVGSDHTDREFEKHDIPASKQMCSKPVAPVFWELEDIKSHLDKIEMRSWSTINGQRRLYQEGRLSDNRSVLEILNGIPTKDQLGIENFCIFCGTFPTKGDIEFGELFEFEMIDPVYKRKIRQSYRLRTLPQYL